MKHCDISISSLGYDMSPNGHQCYNIVSLILIKNRVKQTDFRTKTTRTGSWMYRFTVSFSA